ncbi:ATP-binding protein [Streptomyces sp. PTM05]|uniref:ATP-binding protein n=1 Tax=Streptantibioticus parmotrematis TaxID=2873249 RepID=A0ABS7QZN8_9ACTN|nr:ATP-binding protein [Streptantibioticus parmotrematis]MBY8888670.1 ATP-binding protein [Streptantibioticus parmotrematis]
MDPHDHGPRQQHQAPGPAGPGGAPDANDLSAVFDSGVTAGGSVPGAPRAAASDATAPGDEAAGRSAYRDPLISEAGTGATARVAQVVAGDLLLTVNPVDGSEVVGCPPARIPAVARRTAEDRAARDRAARPAPVTGHPFPDLPVLERAEETDRLVKLVSRGRSVRVTGPAGCGRTALLDAVAERCADLAPDGVIRLTGHRRTVADLLHELYATVHTVDAHRPGPDRLRDLVREIGAVVVLDDVEFGGAPLESLLAAAPECAFVITATPDVAAPLPDSHLEEVFLPGLSQEGCLDLLARVAGRDLSEEESAWAADLWFASEGLPLRFVQAGALLRQRDQALARPGAADLPADAPAGDVPPPPAGRGQLPSLAEAAAPADLLASRLGPDAQEALRFAVALGGECPHSSHLPALVGAEHADAALAELIATGLVTPSGARYRLAAGVLGQLTEGGVETGGYAQTAATHYAWWTGHPSVPAERIAAEADAVLAAMAAARAAGHHECAVRLARAAAPQFAAGLDWGAWERALRAGQEAARLAGDVAEEAYFHHELGVLALCSGNLDRARTELEASIGMRGVLADRQGTIVGRRTLALVTDRAGRPAVPAPVRAEPPAAAPQERLPRTERTPLVPPTVPIVAAGTAAAPFEDAAVTVLTPRVGANGPAHKRRFPYLATRRNLVAAGAGAVLVAVLGTVVTLGATSQRDPSTPMTVKPGGGPAARNDDNSGLPADPSAPATGTSTTPSTAVSGGPATSPSASGGPASGSTGTSPAPGTTETSSAPSGGGRPSPSHSHPAPPPPTQSSPPPSPSPSQSTTPTPSPSTTTTPTGTDSASGPAPTTTGTDSGAPSASDTGSAPAASDSPS